MRDFEIILNNTQQIPMKFLNHGVQSCIRRLGSRRMRYCLFLSFYKYFKIKIRPLRWRSGILIKRIILGIMRHGTSEFHLLVSAPIMYVVNLQ